MKHYYVYILTNKTHTVLYTGVTNHIARRTWQHKHKHTEGFTEKYNANTLVYLETFDNPTNAIQREKQIKAGSRKKKLDKIRSTNPNFRDLYPEIVL